MRIDCDTGSKMSNKRFPDPDYHQPTTSSTNTQPNPFYQQQTAPEEPTEPPVEPEEAYASELATVNEEPEDEGYQVASSSLDDILDSVLAGVDSYKERMPFITKLDDKNTNFFENNDIAAEFFSGSKLDFDVHELVNRKIEQHVNELNVVDKMNALTFKEDNTDQFAAWHEANRRSSLSPILDKVEQFHRYGPIRSHRKSEDGLAMQRNPYNIRPRASRVLRSASGSRAHLAQKYNSRNMMNVGMRARRYEANYPARMPGYPNYNASVGNMQFAPSGSRPNIFPDTKH